MGKSRVFDQQTKKTLRLINLMAYLLEKSRDGRSVGFAELRQTVYRDHRGDSRALGRMFSRDKAELREMGIPLETVKDPCDNTERYRIPNDRYFLPPLDLAPDETAGLALVSQLFLGYGTPFSGAGHSAMIKLGFEDSRGDQGERLPEIHLLTLPQDRKLLRPILEGLRRCKNLTFAYRSLDAQEPVSRTVSPYGLFNRFGAWYLVGFCHLRGEIRTFKLERVTSSVKVNTCRPDTPDFEVPDWFDLEAEMCWKDYFETDPEVTATVEFSPRRAFALASAYEPLDVKRTRSGYFKATYLVRSHERFVDWVLCFGADAKILGPEELIRIAVRKLEGVLRASAPLV